MIGAIVEKRRYEKKQKQILVKLFVQQLHFPICSEFVCLRASFRSERN